MAQQTSNDTGGHPKRVLVVDPHATLRTVLAQRLRQDGHLAAAVATAREALDICQEQSPDLLVSAELLEETSALRLAAQLRPAAAPCFDAVAAVCRKGSAWARLRCTCCCVR